MSPRRVNVSLDEERAAKLTQLAERTHVADGTMARSLLSAAIDEADPDPTSIAHVLAGIPGIHERLGAAEADEKAGRVVELSDL